MSIHVALNHVTEYRYDRAVELGPQIVRLRPAPHSRTRILSYSLKVLPANHFINWQQDPQGNYMARLVFPENTERLRIEVGLVAEMAVFNPFDFFLEPYADTIPFSYGPEERHELTPYLEKLPPSPRLVAYVEAIERTPRATVEFLVALNQKVSEDVRYLVRMEPGVQTPEHTLESGCGSCRDSAWLLVQVLRNLGLAARFVSGYLIQLAADVKALDGPSGPEADFTDLHAWCEVYLPGAGWIGLDATSGLLAGEGHIPLACSPNPNSAAPVTGRVAPCECTFEHAMDVQRLWEAPRVTRPYSERQWEAIQAAGKRVDLDLDAGDVRLTLNVSTASGMVGQQDATTSTRWEALVEHTERLYSQAEFAPLVRATFTLDGRPTSKGGNYMVMGGPTPQGSPFLRRPDLLYSLVGYWNDHPSLSYLFAGACIGPGSPAPRVDETRGDGLYELEVAFAQLAAMGADAPPGQLDRLLHHLLADISGTTHRAQGCIDQLGAPPGSHQPLGLLALRAFEMPPHPRMSLVQQLLLRGLVAWFWRTPYRPARLVRWGADLHDRFLLPHFIAQDLADVLQMLNGAGYPFLLEWFAPHLEFRFPKAGDHAVAGMELELRQALEPCQAPPLERLQVKVAGLVPERYVLTCNGVPVPLRATGVTGEYVAGIRYQAWQPDNALSAAFAPHTPLVFDLVDTWMQRSLGGCQYHVTPPGGGLYNSLPVNGNEAESRRLARFSRIGHTPGVIVIPPRVVNETFPVTLDMRLHA